MNRFAIIPLVALALLPGACNPPTSDFAAVKSSMPSISVNALNAANVYRAAKAAGAPEFAGSVSAAQILDDLERGVKGSGPFSESVFHISPIPEDERDKVIHLLKENLGLGD